MNNTVDIINEVKSGVCKISFYDKQGEQFNSGSGFLYKESLISNNHVFFDQSDKPFDKDVLVGIRFGNDSYEGKDPITIPYENFMKVIKAGSTRQNFDYAAFEIKEIDWNKHYQFELDSREVAVEGEQVLVMGYPFGARNLTSHIGYISSIYNDGRIDIIQLDISTNNGNSGGPVVDLKTKKVIGYVTRKQTGLAEQFDVLMKSFDQNIEIFDKASQGVITFGGINYKEALKVTQEQMKVLSTSIKRSANTGIGYAFSLSGLKEGTKDLPPK